MGKQLTQKMSKNKYIKINPKNIKNKYLKPISNREKKFIKDRSIIEAIFEIYCSLIIRIINGSLLIKDVVFDIFGMQSSGLSNWMSVIVGGISSYGNIFEMRDRINSGEDVNKLREGKYVLRDREFMEKNYYYLFLEQLGAIINMSKKSNYYEYFRRKSVELSGKYGKSFWVVFMSMLGLANIMNAIETSNQEIKNLFIDGTDIINEPYMVIEEEKNIKKCNVK